MGKEDNFRFLENQALITEAEGIIYFNDELSWETEYLFRKRDKEAL